MAQAPRFEWTYARPASTFADLLLIDGRRSGGEINRYIRVEPKGAARPGQPMVIGPPYYAGLVSGEPIPGEYEALRDAQAAVEQWIADGIPHSG